MLSLERTLILIAVCKGGGGVATTTVDACA
ncbi:MAG: hypothetical protein JWR37_443, partial [Mycobacterium sp.]|nr:hypothetical protein [Mycobacterium sp.]